MRSVRSSHVSASLAVLLCVLVNLFHNATAQNCKTVAPCTDPDSVIRLASYTNATLFAEAREECGDTIDAISEAMVASCLDEFDVRPGCDCGTSGCRAALQTLVAQTCKRAILKTVCRAADWLEPQVGANVRSIYLHVLNDCAVGSTEGCSADNFDESLCAGFPASAPSEAPAVAGSPRCNENITALFNTGPGPGPMEEPAQAPPMPVGMAPEPMAVPAPAPAPVVVAPSPAAVLPNTAEEPEVADVPSQGAREAAGDSSEDPVAVPEAGAAMHTSGGIAWGAIAWAACAMVIVDMLN